MFQVLFSLLIKPDFDQWRGRIPRRHPHFPRPSFIHFTHEGDITAKLLQKESKPQKAWFWNLFMHCSPFSGQSEDMDIHNHILKWKVFSCTWSTTTVVDVGCNKFTSAAAYEGLLTKTTGSSWTKVLHWYSGLSHSLMINRLHSMLVSYPTRWSFSFILGPLHWSSSWQWQPSIFLTSRGKRNIVQLCTNSMFTIYL